MPRIRKKTSKRGTTNQRAKIKHKVAESRKKRKKEAKKNPQWKTKHPKDPGIPNNFPFKDQILAEVMEQRREAEEAKERRKEEKRAAKAAASTSAANAESGDDSDTPDAGVELDALGMTEARGSLQKAKPKGKAQPLSAEDETEAPLLINPDLQSLQAVLDQVDVLVHVLDARDPLPYLSLDLVSKQKDSHKTVIVLSKIDACPREALSSWLKHFRSQYPTFAIRSSSSHVPQLVEQAKSNSLKGKSKEQPISLSDAWGIDALVSYLSGLAKEKKSSEEALAVAFVGVVNSGKSSLINSILRQKTFDVYDVASPSDGRSTTSNAQELPLQVGGREIRLIDTPGLAWDATAGENTTGEFRVRDILIRNRGRIERIKDSAPLVDHIVSRTEPQELMLFYNVAAFLKGDTGSFISSLGRTKGLIKKSGDVDSAGAARVLLNDWRTGKFPRYSIPPPTSTPAPPTNADTDAQLVELYAKDAETLNKLSTKKDLRKSSTGLVRLAASPAESRKVAFETSWTEDAGESSDDDEEEVDNDGDVRIASADVEADVEGEAEFSSDEDEEDKDEDGEEDEAPPLPGKRKRASKPSAHQPPSKKVTFAAAPKSKAAERKARKETSEPDASSQLKSTRTKSAAAVGGKNKKTKPSKAPANGKKAGATKTTSSDGQAYDFGQFFKS